MNTDRVSFLLCFYLGQTRRGGEEEQRAERGGLPVEERLLRRTAVAMVKGKRYGDETGEEKIKQMVANTSQKGNILDIDNDNLLHTKLLWGLTTSELLNVIKNRKKYCLDGNARCTKVMLLGGGQDVASEQKNEYTKLIF